MATGKGVVPGPKKKSSRKSNAHGAGRHGIRDAKDEANIVVPGVKHFGGQAGGTCTSIPSAGSSGKQAQMVFTIGTFDDDDDSYINDQLHNTAGVATSHMQARLLGARRSVDISSTAEPDTDARPLLDGRVDSSELPTSWKGAGLTKPSAAQRLQLKRQTLFTMGSHSEASDMDGADAYAEPPGRSAYAAYHSASSSNSSADSTDMADAVVTNNSSRDDHAVPESSPEQRVPDSNTIPDTGELAVSALNHSTNMASSECEERNDCGGGARSSNKSSEINRGEDTCSPNVLHMCTASTSLSQLGRASDSVNSIDAATSNSASGQDSSSVGLPERVASAPAIQAAANAQGNGSCISFALCDNREPSETSPAGKGKAPLARESYAKARKRVGSKKPHLKKAVSTAALRARSRLGGAQRRDTLAPKAPTQLGGAVEGDGLADCSYVDYSGNSDVDEDHCQVEVGVQQPADLQADTFPPQTTSANAARISPHSSTATLDGESQDVDDSASTASIDSPQPEHSRALSANQRPPNAADNARTIDQTDSTSGENYCDQGGSCSPPLLRRDEISRDRAGSDLIHTYVTVADPPPSGDPAVADTGATQTASETRQSRTTGQNQHGNNFRTQGETAVSAGASMGQSAYVTLTTKRNMESQRQQSMVEKEEEDLDIANSLVTGVPRRQNRPSGMAPYIYLNPNSPAYSQQVRTMERTYGHVRTMAHPMLESISRCVALREQRLAFAVPHGQARAWTSRRMPTEPSEANLQSEWWESLMPPPPSNLVSNREPRTAPGHSTRLQPTELPPWVLVPDDAKCAVYGPDMSLMMPCNGIHGQIDASCVHVRELREHAKELKHVRQQAISAPRNQVLTLPRQPAITSPAELETWRGRRVPGLLSVDIYAGAAGPLDPSARQTHLSGAEPRSSPSPEPTPLLRGNPLAPPYRRYGTVYGYTSDKAASAWPGQAAALPTTALGGGVSQGSAALSLRGFDGAPTARPSTVGIWDSDPRRSSYFDRLSIDETRPQLPSSAAQTSATGLLRRVISGLTGGATAFGTSQ